jgi:adenylate cyclase class 2
MREIEVKAWIRDEAAFMHALELKGIELSKVVFQHDTIFVTLDWEFTKFNADRNILRIRCQDGKNVLTLKRPGAVDLESYEYETEIKDPESMAKILDLIEYKPFLEVKKYRQKSQFGDYEICFDKVEGLGSFVEVEILIDGDEDAVPVQESLFKFLEALGIGRADRETRGYDTMIRLLQEGNL